MYQGFFGCSVGLCYNCMMFCQLLFYCYCLDCSSLMDDLVYQSFLNFGLVILPLFIACMTDCCQHLYANYWDWDGLTFICMSFFLSYYTTTVFVLIHPWLLNIKLGAFLMKENSGKWQWEQFLFFKMSSLKLRRKGAFIKLIRV